jgi:hypothetical protein
MLSVGDQGICRASEIIMTMYTFRPPSQSKWASGMKVIVFDMGGRSDAALFYHPVRSNRRQKLPQVAICALPLRSYGPVTRASIN